ncbi:hypothetical protein [Sphingomonas sp.]|uniref:hypothetical protein n=1 Tax=Sphingomonas sp. TaxID=28214 RepID=UPI0028AF8BF0|nr:hypothetical protein [Sphingomonas sp.]
MFNLIVRHFEWDAEHGEIGADRLFEHTDGPLAAQFKNGEVPDYAKLSGPPCLFMTEGTGDEECRVGQVSNVRRVGRDITFDFTLARDIPPLTNKVIYDGRRKLGMDDWEFSRNHWAVKNVDLFRFIVGAIQPRRSAPAVFKIPENEKVDVRQLSVMMPFAANFSDVYAAIKQAAEEMGFICHRVDDIWENHSIIQDVVELIDRSRIVICDCSTRNANVFYETGIAHTLGREVILLTQSADDIPFDLRHLRYISYLNNGEGRQALAVRIKDRIQTIMG